MVRAPNRLCTFSVTKAQDLLGLGVSLPYRTNELSGTDVRYLIAPMPLVQNSLYIRLLRDLIVHGMPLPYDVARDVEELRIPHLVVVVAPEGQGGWPEMPPVLTTTS